MNCFYEDGHDCEVLAVMSVFIAKGLESLTAYIPAIFATTEDNSSKDKMPASKQEGSGRKVHPCTFVG